MEKTLLMSSTGPHRTSQAVHTHMIYTLTRMRDTCKLIGTQTDRTHMLINVHADRTSFSYAFSRSVGRAIREKWYFLSRQCTGGHLFIMPSHRDTLRYMHFSEHSRLWVGCCEGPFRAQHQYCPTPEGLGVTGDHDIE